MNWKNDLTENLIWNHGLSQSIRLQNWGNLFFPRPSAFDNLLVPQPSWSPSTTQQLRKLVAAPYLSPNDWTPRSEAYFVFPLAQGTPGKQCGLAATGVYQPSLRSPWLAAEEKPGRLLLDRRPSQEGLAWVKYEMDGQEVEVDLLAVELVAFMEA